MTITLQRIDERRYPGRRVTLAATGSHQDEMLGSVSSQASGLYVLPEQELLNVNVDWESLGGLPLDLSLFATNVTEEKFYTFTTGASFGFDSLNLNEPRMYGARPEISFRRRLISACAVAR